MKLRRFGLLLLVLVGILVVVAGLIVVRRAEGTALRAVRLGNERVAARAAVRIGGYVDTEVLMFRTLSAALAPSVGFSPRQAERILKNYRIAFPHLRDLDVVGPDCIEIATSRLDGVVRSRCDDPAVKAALGGEIHRGDVVLSRDFAPVMTLGVPLELAGERVGAAVGVIDLVGMWGLVADIRVGDDGYARLLAADGRLLAHGNAEERRVLVRDKDPLADEIRAAGGHGMRYRDSQGRDVIGVAAAVPQLGWLVVVEQPVAEAYRAARTMRRDLILVIDEVLGLTIAGGIGLGTPPVRALERMREHARDVARGNLSARMPLPRLEELRSVAIALNDMGAALSRLQEEIRTKERLSTFARVAAGLAHDLQTPIEAIRSAWELSLAAPDDPMALELLHSAATSHLPRLSRYVRDLRRLAAHGEIPLELTTVDPRALAERVIDDATSSPKWEGVTFAVEGESPAILADESLLARAVANLVGNAADACMALRPFGGSVTVRIGEGPDPDTLELAVVDTGVGIGDTQLRELFTHDFRSSKRSTGVGLGVGVVRHIATAHGGRVTAEGRPGEGSTFRLFLPRRGPGAARRGPKGSGTTGAGSGHGDDE